MNPTESHRPISPSSSDARSPKKRKRTDSENLPLASNVFAPELRLPPVTLEQSEPPVQPPLSSLPVSITPEATNEGLGKRSPRAVIATKFEGLALRGNHEATGALPTLHLGSTEHDLKRARTAEREMRGHMKLDNGAGAKEYALTVMVSPFSFNMRSSEAEAVQSSQAPVEFQHARKTPLPPRQVSRKSPPLASSSDITFFDLTWQDSEITGHLALDPDDDLTGMNGIGFKPTPQVAYARAQARRKQVTEWKNREAREARARRAEGRRRAMVTRNEAAQVSEDKAGRVVRFAA